MDKTPKIVVPDNTKLDTPCLILDQTVFFRNLDALREEAARLNVRHRAHFKTAKSIEVIKAVTQYMDVPRIAVSTLKEAEVAVRHGIYDIYYTTPITPPKIEQAAQLLDKGAKLTVFVESLEGAKFLAECFKDAKEDLSAVIEIDADGYRGGLSPADPTFHDTAAELSNASGIKFNGLYVFAGRTYKAKSRQEGAEITEVCRLALVNAAQKLRDHGITVEHITIGGSPVSKFAEHLDGVDELCAGVYMFQDLFQEGIGVCGKDNLAVSVLATVIGVNKSSKSAFIDAGALALSQDVSANTSTRTIGYGLASSKLNEEADFYVSSVSQEHGRLIGHNGIDASAHLSIGDQVRVWPNHVCMTAAGFEGYHILSGEKVEAFWSRINGW